MWYESKDGCQEHQSKRKHRVAVYCNWEGQGESEVLFWIAKFQKPTGHLSGDVG